MTASRRRILVVAAAAVTVLVSLYVIVPQLVGVEQTWRRIEHGSVAFLGLAAAFEAGSFAGYVWLLRRLCARADHRLGRRAATEVTLAGVAATRLVNVAGAGGIAVTIDGLRRAGMPTRAASEVVALDLVALYAVFFALMLGDGVLLLALGDHHAALTILPVVFATGVIAAALVTARAPSDVERRVRARWGRRAAVLSALPAVLATGVRGAVALVRTRDPAVLAALAWWVLDVAALWACNRAFGGSLGVPELLMAHLIGHVANVIPVPGGVGAVEGGMIGALVAFGEPAGLALVAVLSYQLVSTWAPALPGAVAFLRLRRRHPAQAPDEPPKVPR
jgi:uncharacterized protein (TIRG00374 family)